MEQAVLVWAMSIWIVVLSILFSKWAFGRILSPVTAYVVPWASMVSLYHLPTLPWRTLELSDYWLIAISLFSYVAGVAPVAVLSKLVNRENPPLTCLIHWNKSLLRNMVLGLFMLTLIGTTLYVRQVSTIGALVEWNLSQLNGQMVSGQLRFLGITGRLMRLNGVVVALVLIAWDEFSKSEKKIYGCIALVSFTISMLSTRRSVAFLLLVWLLMILLVKHDLNKRTLAYSATVMMVSLLYFSTWQMFLNKSTVVNAPFIKAVVHDSLVYLTGNLDTLRPLMGSVHEFSYGLVTLYPIGIALSKVLPSVVERPDLAIPFYAGSVPFNTTPYLYYAYRDFGILGVLVVPYLLGFAVASVYVTYCRKPHPVYLALSALALTAILFTIRQNSLGDYDLWFWGLVASVTLLMCAHTERDERLIVSAGKKQAFNTAR